VPANEGKRRWPELARRVAGARQRAMMTQEEAGRAAGMAGSYVGLIELGRRRPTPEMLRKLAKALNVPSKEFLEAAEYDLDEDDIELPADAVAMLRRLVARGLGPQGFEKIEKFALWFLLDADAVGKRDASPDRDANSAGSRYQEDDVPSGQSGTYR
jgi:transcriptional regulator with XRE-family HTH domain